MNLPTHCSNCNASLTGNGIAVMSADPKKRHPCRKCAEEMMPLSDPEPLEEQFSRFVKPDAENMGSAGWKVAPAIVRLWVRGQVTLAEARGETRVRKEFKDFQEKNAKTLLLLLSRLRSLLEEREECLKYCHEQNGLSYCKNCSLGAKDNEADEYGEA